MKEVKVRLKENITDEQFLDATFGNSKNRLGLFDVEKMKISDLNATDDDTLLAVSIIYKDVDYESTIFDYFTSRDIWEVLKD
jgi:hypothetical protein